MTTKVSIEDFWTAKCLAGMLPGAFVSGSAILDLSKANDVDIVVAASNWDVSSPLVTQFGLLRYTPEDLQEYSQDVKDSEIVHLYRGNHNINLIIVSDLYYPAYKAGELEYLRNPHLYRDSKSAREVLHKDMKAVIRSMLDGSWQEDRRPPNVWRTIHGLPIHAGFSA